MNFITQLDWRGLIPISFLECSGGYSNDIMANKTLSSIVGHFYVR